MNTSKRAEANRRNALQSTGPRTLGGKARSRLNAVTHGLTAQTLILPGEDPRAYQRRLDTWTANLQPSNAFEHDLVRRAVTHSWRLDRADRVQAELIADGIASRPDEEAQRRREEVEDLGRRLWPEPRVPNPITFLGVTIDLGRLQTPTDPDDPNDPARLVARLESTAEGCRWLIDRWALLRPIVDAGTAWPPDEMTRAIRLLGKQRLEAVDDPEVLAIIVACFAMDRTRPDPFAMLWETLTRPEVQYYRERLLGRKLRAAMPRSKERAREVLLEVVDAAVERLRALEAEHRERDAARAEARAESLLYDDSPEGRWVRGQQSKYTRSIVRIVERFRAARRRGEALSPKPPAPPRRERRPARPAASSPRAPEPRRRPDRRERRYQRMTHAERNGYQRPEGAYFRNAEERPRSGPSRAERARRREAARRRRKRLSPAQAEQNILKLMRFMGWLGLIWMLAGAVRWTEAAPASERSGVAGAVRGAWDRDGSAGPPWSGLSGPESLTGPLNRGFHPRKRQIEAKAGQAAPVLPAVGSRLGRPVDRSRGPPEVGDAPSWADRSSSEPSDAGPSWSRAP